MKKEKRYFYDEMMSKENSTSIIRGISIASICIIIVSFIVGYFYDSKKHYDVYNSSYPENMYVHLEEVADRIINNGDFYVSKIPEGVKFEFTDDGDLELYYDQADVMNKLISMGTKITIQLSKEFEIQSKTRNILSYKEFQRKLKEFKIFNCIAVTLEILALIIFFVYILWIVCMIVSYSNKRRDMENKS